MKKRLYFFAVLSCILMTGCIDDKGNYTYEDPEGLIPVILTEFEEEYDLISLERLVLEVEVKGNENNYEYLWYLYPTAYQGVRPDTVSREKKLDYLVTNASGGYTLVFKATDKTTGIAAYRSIGLNITSLFGLGYYVEKYENGGTNVDFVDRYGDVNANILTTVNGEGLTGRPVGLTFNAAGYAYVEENEDGSTTRHTDVPFFLVCSDNDMRLYHGENWEQIKGFDELFMEVPEVRKPEAIMGSSVGHLLKNDGKIHQLSTSSYYGLFGYEWPGDYEISDYLTNGTTSLLAFDNKNGVFLTYAHNLNTPTETKKFEGYEAIFYAAQPYYSFISYYQFAILRHKTTGNAIVTRAMLGSYQSDVPVPADADILSASIFAMSGTLPTGTGKTAIYYSHGDNLVHYYNYANEITRLSAVTLPADEKVVYIKNISDAVYGPELFLVLAEKSGNWKLYVHELDGSTHDVKSPARETYEGTGAPNAVIYRHANKLVTY